MSCRADHVKIDNDVVISVKSYLFSGIMLLLDKTIICDKMEMGIVVLSFFFIMVAVM